jgi:hypothetical protein
MWVFGGQGGGQVNVTETLLKVGLVQASYAFHLLLKPVT